MFAPENRPSQKETRIPTYSNHPFSGAMLVLGRVVNHFVDNVFFFWSLQPARNIVFVCLCNQIQQDAIFTNKKERDPKHR